MFAGASQRRQAERVHMAVADAGRGRGFVSRVHGVVGATTESRLVSCALAGPFLILLFFFFVFI